MIELSSTQLNLLRIITNSYHTQEDFEGGTWNQCDHSVRFPASSDLVKESFTELVGEELLAVHPPVDQNPRDEHGFSDEDNFWVGYPGSVDEVGNPLDSKEAEMAKDKQEEAEVKGKRAAKSRAASLEGVKGEDFFQENAKKKSVFRPGHDAKAAAIFKRIAAGKGSADDKRLMKDKGLTGHPKVTESTHLSELLAEARAA